MYISIHTYTPSFILYACERMSTCVYLNSILDQLIPVTSWQTGRTPTRIRTLQLLVRAQAIYINWCSHSVYLDMNLIPWQTKSAPIRYRNPRRPVRVQTVCLQSGPCCSKLTTSLVNYSLKFTSSDTQIFCKFLLKKCE